MGSFAYTCQISGLPIEAGDAVRYLLLTQNPYNRGKTAGKHQCYSTDAWFPRTFPLRAKYNDYGGVENLQKGPQRTLWKLGLKRDLVEKGWGDNSVHDQAVRKDMPLTEILGAIHHGRLMVRREVKDYSLERLKKALKAARKLIGDKSSPTLDDVEELLSPKKELHESVPTRARVEKALVDAGFRLHGDQGEGEGEGYLVDKIDHRCVRIRVGSYAERIKPLEDIRGVLSKWSTVITSGTGRYASNGEMLVFQPPVEDPMVRTHKLRDADNSPLAVTHTMIREDVWQAICNLPIKPYWDKKAITAESSRKQQLKAFKKYAAARSDHPIDRLHIESNRDMEAAPHFTSEHGGIPYATGLGTSWAMMLDRREKWPQGEIDDFINTAGEMAFICHWLGMTRFAWHPSTGGPQFGEFRLHSHLLNAFNEIATDIANEQDKEREDDGADEAGDTA